MGRRLHTAMVYFGLAEDEAVAARFEEPSAVRSTVMAFVLLAPVVAGLWALARLVGFAPGLVDLAIAAGALALLFALASVVGTDDAPPSRTPWRELLDHAGAYLGLWSCFVLLATLAGHRPGDRALGAIAASVAGLLVIDGLRLAWRARRRAAS